jgi:hypothetical protein
MGVAGGGQRGGRGRRPAANDSHQQHAHQRLKQYAETRRKHAPGNTQHLSAAAHHLHTCKRGRVLPHRPQDHLRRPLYHQGGGVFPLRHPPQVGLPDLSQRLLATRRDAPHVLKGEYDLYVSVGRCSNHYHFLAGLRFRLLSFFRESRDCLRAFSESSTRGGRDYWG